MPIGESIKKVVSEKKKRDPVEYNVVFVSFDEDDVLRNKTTLEPILDKESGDEIPAGTLKYLSNGKEHTKQCSHQFFLAPYNKHTLAALRKLNKGDKCTVRVDKNNYYNLMEVKEGHVASNPSSGPGESKGGSYGDSLGAKIGQALNAATNLVTSGIVDIKDKNKVVDQIGELALQIATKSDELRDVLSKPKVETVKLDLPDNSDDVM